MASLKELEEEIKELVENYKCKRTSVYEPCTIHNYKECLIGLREELSLLNINYIFNPHIDVDENSLSLEALVKFINAVWTLLHHHKNTLEKTEGLTEQNHILEQNSKQLNGMINKLKDKVNVEKNEARACVATARRLSDHSDEVVISLTSTKAQLASLVKQKAANERKLKNEISRLTLENEKFQHRLRTTAGTYTPCSIPCDTTLNKLMEREKKQRTVISQLQRNNQELLQEVIALKENILIDGLSEYHIDK